MVEKTSKVSKSISRFRFTEQAINVSIQNSPSFVDTALLLPLHKKDVCTE